MRILAAILPPDTAGAILECLGLPARPPPRTPARRSGGVTVLLDTNAVWSRN